MGRPCNVGTVLVIAVIAANTRLLARAAPTILVVAFSRKSTKQ
jgi:hypothetical protein